MITTSTVLAFVISIFMVWIVLATFTVWKLVSDITYRCKKCGERFESNRPLTYIVSIMAIWPIVVELFLTDAFYCDDCYRQVRWGDDY